METKNKIYFDNIDALRFLAFMFVFVSHLFFSNNPVISSSLTNFRKHLLPYAYMGVGFFFTLSGFLITFIILVESTVNNGFNLKNFYMRRALRIWPLYFTIVAIAYISYFFIGNVLKTSSDHLPNIWWFLTFTVNYYIGYINKNIVFFLAFLWSIAVEEQFYLLWGIVMRFFSKNVPAIATVMLLIYIVFIVLRAGNVIRPPYFNLLNYLPNFGLGAFLAYTCFKGTPLFNLLKGASLNFWKSFYVILIIALVFFQEQKVTLWVHALRQLMLTVFFCLLLFDQCFNTAPLFKMGSNKWINYMGKISFGLYCWHGVVITIIKKSAGLIHYKETYWDVLLIYPLLTLLLTIVVSIISYELMEIKFLKLKNQFS